MVSRKQKPKAKSTKNDNAHNLLSEKKSSTGTAVPKLNPCTETFTGKESSQTRNPPTRKSTTNVSWRSSCRPTIKARKELHDTQRMPSHGPRDLNLIYTTVTETETDSSDGYEYYDDSEYDDDIPDCQAPSPDEPLLSIITPAQLRASIRKKNSTVSNSKKKSFHLKELQAHKFLKTIKTPVKAISSISEEKPRNSTIPKKTVSLQNEQKRQRPPSLPSSNQRQAPWELYSHTKVSTQVFQTNTICEEVDDIPTKPPSLVRKVVKTPCQGLDKKVGMPIKPPSLAREDMSILRNHLNLQRVSFAMPEMESMSTTLTTTVKLTNNSTIRKSASSFKKTVAITQKTTVPTRQKVFKKTRANEYQIQDIEDEIQSDDHSISIREEEQLQHLRSTRDSTSSTDSAEAHYTKPRPRVIAQLQSAFRKQKVPILKTPTSAAREPKSENSKLNTRRKVSFKCQDDSFCSNTKSSITVNSSRKGIHKVGKTHDYRTSCSDYSTDDCRPKPKARKRTMRTVSRKSSKRKTVSFKQTTYETFKVTKSKCTQSKPQGPRDIDPYANYHKPFRKPYRIKKRFKPFGFNRAMMVLVNCGGLAVLFQKAKSICMKK